MANSGCVLVHRFLNWNYPLLGSKRWKFETEFRNIKLKLN